MKHSFRYFSKFIILPMFILSATASASTSCLDTAVAVSYGWSIIHQAQKTWSSSFSYTNLPHIVPIARNITLQTIALFGYIGMKSALSHQEDDSQENLLLCMLVSSAYAAAYYTGRNRNAAELHQQNNVNELATPLIHHLDHRTSKSKSERSTSSLEMLTCRER